MGEEAVEGDCEAGGEDGGDVKKKKQHYRYSQSRWNTNNVVSSISKIKATG